ncbi:MAG TPA: hypothetical protein VLS25_13450 [Dehalococcoidia bacterium]|nr:hypothetical protein [Dehalococcoidia bacterium]
MMTSKRRSAAGLIVPFVAVAWAAAACGGNDGSPATGLQIAYSDGSAVRLVDTGSGDARTLEGCSAAERLVWAPTGDKLACEGADAGSGAARVAIVDGDGKRIAEFQADPGTFDWSPDGVRYSYSKAEQGKALIYMGAEEEPALLAVGLAETPVWLPDGRLAVYRPKEAAAPGDPQAPHLDLYSGAVAYHLHKDLRALAPIEGGRVLIAAKNYARSQSGVATFDAYMVNPRTDSQYRVEGMDSAQFWVSQDGSRAAFLRPGGSTRTISIIDFATLHTGAVPGSSITFPRGGAIPAEQIAFSPDGKTLYWTNAGSGGDVYRAPVDGGAPVKLAAFPTANRAAFSPDRSRIAYVGGQGAGSLWVAGVDGKEAREIGPIAGGFAWRPPIWRATSTIDSFQLESVARQEDNAAAFGGGNVSIVPQELTVRLHVQNVDRVDIILSSEASYTLAKASGYPDKNGEVEVKIRLPEVGTTYFVSALGVLAADAPAQPAERQTESNERAIASQTAYHVRSD